MFIGAQLQVDHRLATRVALLDGTVNLTMDLQLVCFLYVVFAIALVASQPSTRNCGGPHATCK